MGKMEWVVDASAKLSEEKQVLQWLLAAAGAGTDG